METFKLGSVESCMKDIEALLCHHGHDDHALAYSVCAVDTCYT